MYLKIIPRLALILLLIAPSWARAETVLYSRNVYSLCTQEDMDWINFCNGLIQGNADYVVLAGASCIPAGTTRTTLITIFIDRLPSSSAYSNDKPALEAVIEVFSRIYPCN